MIWDTKSFPGLARSTALTEVRRILLYRVGSILTLTSKYQYKPPLNDLDFATT
jgi:hypothetical protein